jgi:hypothetical protein
MDDERLAALCYDPVTGLACLFAIVVILIGLFGL